MAKRSYRRKAEEPERTSYDTTLATHMPVANYYRQSTTAQVGNNSTDIQTVDMAAYLNRLGWAEKNIIMIDMDAGVSGATKIDEREGMSQLFRLITTDKVGAVSCQDEDRLFRDVTQIQVNIFIEACKQHKVLVITPSMIYNFHHEQTGLFHARQFRFKGEVAAEYISSYVLGKLYQAKRRMVMNGRWVGPPIPLGYMIDERKTLPYGSPNENWRKFAIFEPYSECRYYVYRYASKVTDSGLWRKKASTLDDAVTGLLLKKLKATFDFRTWKAALETFSEDLKREQQLKRAQLEHVRRVMDNLVMSLGSLQNQQMIAAVENQYTEAQREHERLSQELDASMQEQRRMEQIDRLKDSCEEVVADWPGMTADERRQVVHAFVSRIEATRVDKHALHLRIEWQDLSESEVILPRETGNGNFWLTEELDLLVKLMQSEPDQTKVAAQFPHRPWETLRKKYRAHSLALGKSMKVKFSPKRIRDRETYYDYLERLGREDATNGSSDSYSAASPHRTLPGSWR